MPKENKELHTVRLDHICIVLQKPRYPENIGSAARAMRNMGISKLKVVQPEKCDLNRIVTLATHAAMDVIEDMEVYDSLEEALSQCQYIVGTTARLGGERPVVTIPSRMAQKLISISQKNTIAIVFGPEDRGLSNDDIKYCHLLVTIPTDEFSSLNLAQAVMIICYELFLASCSDLNPFIPKLANHFELEAMYKQLQEILVRINFLHYDNSDHWMLNIRRFFSRMPLRSKDIKIIRGICRQIDWYSERQFLKYIKNDHD